VELAFEWDPAKAERNAREHGVTFEEARTVFSDERALFDDDPDESVGERRFILLGLSSALRLLVVCHCERGDGHVIRLISARKAVKAEQNQYWRRVKR
jgi:uncharacterized DUF497 family protein